MATEAEGGEGVVAASLGRVAMAVAGLREVEAAEAGAAEVGEVGEMAAEEMATAEVAAAAAAGWGAESREVPVGSEARAAARALVEAEALRVGGGCPRTCNCSPGRTQRETARTTQSISFAVHSTRSARTKTPIGVPDNSPAGSIGPPRWDSCP